MVVTCGMGEIVVHHAETGDEAISILTRDPYEAAVIAPMVADFDGLDLVRRLRTCRVKVPLVLLAKSSTPEFRARALWDGADDVMDLPWSPDEMIARLKSLGRRTMGHTGGIIKLGDIILDQERMRVLDESGVQIHLTEKEYLILELLAVRRGRVCSKNSIMGHLYGGMDEPEEKIVDVFVCKLRRKLGRQASMIETVWGRGYMIQERIPPLSAQAA